MDAAEEVLLRAARDLALLDLVPMIESALRTGDATRTALEALCETGRPGVRRLRLGTALADVRSESYWETALRLFHVSVDIPVETQVELFDEQGTFLARADLLLTGTNNVHEYDGGGHRLREQHAHDLRRERRLAGTSYVRRGYTAEDLVRHPLVMLAEIDRAIGRRHRPERVRLWRRWRVRVDRHGRGPPAPDEPVAAPLWGQRLVTNRMRLLHCPAVGDQTATRQPRESGTQVAAAA